MGNVGSVQNMLKKIGVKSKITFDFKDIEKSKKIILPGVGAFDNAMKKIKEYGIIPLLNHKVNQDKTPVLGICLGMQIMAKKSEEGELPGLGWIDAEVKKFRFESNEHSNLKIPHMGWNKLRIKKSDPLYDGLADDSRFYFVHSYHMVCNNKNNVLAETEYGYDFASVVSRDNIIGVQFHPEKSHKFGIKLLKNFIENY